MSTVESSSVTREGVRRAVHAAVAASLDRPLASITDASRFLYDLEVDSIAVLDLLCALEETFDVAIDEVEAFPVETVGELVELLFEELQTNEHARRPAPMLCMQPEGETGPTGLPHPR